MPDLPMAPLDRFGAVGNRKIIAGWVYPAMVLFDLDLFLAVFSQTKGTMREDKNVPNRLHQTVTKTTKINRSQ